MPHVVLCHAISVSCHCDLLYHKYGEPFLCVDTLCCESFLSLTCYNSFLFKRHGWSEGYRALPSYNSAIFDWWMRIILRSLISSLVLLGRVVQFLCVWSFRTLDCVLLEVPTMSCYVLSCPAM